MNKEITITIKPQEENNKSLIENLISKELKKQGIQPNEKIITKFIKKSIDARHDQLKYHLN